MAFKLKIHSLSVPQSDDNTVKATEFISPIGNAKVVFPELGNKKNVNAINYAYVLGDRDSFVIDSDNLTLTLTL